MRKIKWILQKNLLKETTLLQLKKALEKDNVNYEEVKIIPFSDELPTIEESTDYKVFYGSTTLVLNASLHHKFKEGVFYDKEAFNMKNYFEKWGSHMLNYDSEILTFNEIIAKNYQHGNWFVRPIYDDKAFSGCVMSFAEIEKLEKSLAQSNNPYLTPETLVAIAKPKQIKKEWRHFIVDKKIISSSKYAENGNVNKSSLDVPPALLTFVEKRCQEYVPNAIFVMDTALHENGFKIVECNCFNDTGFYANDIQKIIQEVNAYLKQQISS